MRGRVGSRADQRHFTSKDIEKLRQLVEARAPEERSDAGDSRIIWPCLRHARIRMGIMVHAAKLVDQDAVVVKAVTFLPEDDRATTVDLDRNGNDNKQRCDDHQQQESY